MLRNGRGCIVGRRLETNQLSTRRVLNNSTTVVEMGVREEDVFHLEALLYAHAAVKEALLLMCNCAHTSLNTSLHTKRCAH